MPDPVSTQVSNRETACEWSVNADDWAQYSCPFLGYRRPPRPLRHCRSDPLQSGDIIAGIQAMARLAVVRRFQQANRVPRADSQTGPLRQFTHLQGFEWQVSFSN